MNRGSIYALLPALLTGAALYAANTPATQVAEPVRNNGALQPFDATYSVIYRGLNAGTSEFQLERQSDNRYLYTSRSNARGLFRMFFDEEILQTSLMKITDAGVRPLRFRADDGSDDTKRDISLDFDWDANRVSGVAENEKVNVELPAQTQDTLSIQIAVIHDLQRGREPASYTIVDKNQVKDYTYTHEGAERLKTAVGELDTVIYRSQRTGSNKRITRTWLAPSLGYTPVRAERIKDGKREWLMEIRALQR